MEGGAGPRRRRIWSRPRGCLHAMPGYGDAELHPRPPPPQPHSNSSESTPASGDVCECVPLSAPSLAHQLWRHVTASELHCLPRLLWAHEPCIILALSLAIPWCLGRAHSSCCVHTRPRGSRQERHSRVTHSTHRPPAIHSLGCVAAVHSHYQYRRNGSGGPRGNRSVPFSLPHPLPPPSYLPAIYVGICGQGEQQIQQGEPQTAHVAAEGGQARRE